ncbi:MAG TPA: hypothetical protein VM055_06725 [Novosphingobium sp.]|nr:hypothetical protein [Novosphingobium sp.]
MSDAKPFASLSPTLLARKGGARPAMRPQLQPLGHYPAPEPTMSGAASEEFAHDDLGWNDMGEPQEAPAAPEPNPEHTVVAFVPSETPAETAPLPEVVRQQDALAGQVASEPPSALIPLARHRWARAERDERNQRRSALADGRRAAFTLRVDDARHLKLRLACTVQGRSAQQIVTEALDRLLDELPELDDLARRVKRR